jgi:hypothetical protein
VSYEKQVWSKYDALKSEEENIENGAVVTDNRMNHMEDGISNSDDNLASHVADTNNPHKVTAAQAGLGNVQNFGLATENEAKQGASNAKYMTPSLTQAVLSANINSIAYANSSDGVDGFTTVYPNLNLLKNTRTLSSATTSAAWNVLFNSSQIYDSGIKSKSGVSAINFSFNVYVPLNAIVGSSVPIQLKGQNSQANNVGTDDYNTIISNTNYIIKQSDLGTTIRVSIPIQKSVYYQSFDAALSDTASITIRQATDISGFVYSTIKLEPGSTATPWMPSSSEATTADYPKFVGFSNTVKTDKTASDYKWFPTIDSHTNDKANPHAVTAEQVNAYTKTVTFTKTEIQDLLSDAIAQTKLDANPIGTILTTINDTNPSTYLGGTWERFANGRTLVGVDETDGVTLMQTANNMGGSVNPLTKHSHNIRRANGTQQSAIGATISWSDLPNNGGVIQEAGDNTNHNNWQPFVTVYFWRRTA